MAPKNDLAALAAQEALAEKADAKGKRPAQAVEEREFWRIQRGPIINRAPPPPPVETIGEIQPDLHAIMIPPFLLKSAGEGSSCQPKPDRERIMGVLIPEDLKAFEQANDEGLIGRHYAFADFVSILLFLSCPFFFVC